jgi:hypothetical protein
VPHCGSVRFMVPPHSPGTILCRNFSFSSSEAPAVDRLGRAVGQAGIHAERHVGGCRHLRIGQRQDARQALAAVTFGSDDRPSQPFSTIPLYASLKPGGVVTVLSGFPLAADLCRRRYSAARGLRT